MFATNNTPAELAFQEWMNQGPTPPTNGDVVRHERVDMELLHHLAAFMFDKGRKHVPTSAARARSNEEKSVQALAMARGIAAGLSTIEQEESNGDTGMGAVDSGRCRGVVPAAEIQPEHGRRRTTDLDGAALDQAQREVEADGQRVEVTPNA